MRAGYRGAMHQAPQRQVIVADGAMLNQAVVPHQQIPLPPLVRIERLASHDASRRAYGRPRIWKDLAEEGERVSEKRVGRLMREEG